MKTNLLQIRYRSVQAKYAKLLKRYQKKLAGGFSFTARQLADMQRKIEKYSRQLAGFPPNLGKVARMTVLGSSLALGITLSSCGGDDEPTPTIDFDQLSFTQVTGSANPAPSITKRLSVPTLADLNGDGKPDLTIAYWVNNADSTEYYTNTGTASSPAFAKQTGSANTLPIFHGRKTCTFADLDNDGDLDAIFEDGRSSQLRYYKNIGSRTAPNFAL